MIFDFIVRSIFILDNGGVIAIKEIFICYDRY